MAGGVLLRSCLWFGPLAEPTRPPNAQEKDPHGGGRGVGRWWEGSYVTDNTKPPNWYIYFLVDPRALFILMSPCPTSALKRTNATPVSAAARGTQVSLGTRVAYYITGLEKEKEKEKLMFVQLSLVKQQ